MAGGEMQPIPALIRDFRLNQEVLSSHYPGVKAY